MLSLSRVSFGTDDSCWRTDAGPPATDFFVAYWDTHIPWQPNARLAARLSLTPELTRDTRAMTQVANTPRKRNRGRAGEKRVRREAFLSPEFNEDLNAALKASGDLSFALYVQDVLNSLRDEDGKLPVINTTIDSQEAHTAVA